MHWFTVDIHTHIKQSVGFTPKKTLMQQVLPYSLSIIIIARKRLGGREALDWDLSAAVTMVRSMKWQWQ